MGNNGQDSAYFLVNAVRYHELVKAFEELNSRGSMRAKEGGENEADPPGEHLADQEGKGADVTEGGSGIAIEGGSGTKEKCDAADNILCPAPGKSIRTQIQWSSFLLCQFQVLLPSQSS